MKQQLRFNKCDECRWPKRCKSAHSSLTSWVTSSFNPFQSFINPSLPAVESFPIQCKSCSDSLEMMSNPQSATPPWLREDLEVAQPLKEPTGNRSDPSSKAISNERKSKVVYWMLKIVTMCLCVLISATAVIGIGEISVWMCTHHKFLHAVILFFVRLESINGVEASGKMFVACYMLFFSSLLFMFEFVEIRPVEWVDHMLRRNFGFLYGTMGKSLYIIL